MDISVWRLGKTKGKEVSCYFDLIFSASLHQFLFDLSTGFLLLLFLLFCFVMIYQRGSRPPLPEPVVHSIIIGIAADKTWDCLSEHVFSIYLFLYVQKMMG